MADAIDTPAKRVKLRPRKNPYWGGVSGGRGGLSLGYRKRPGRPGTWVAKFVAEGQRREGKIGTADDEPIELRALSYRDAVAAVLQWGRQQYASIESERVNRTKKAPTVRTAVEGYIAAGKTGGRLKRYVLCDVIEAVQLSRLSEGKLAEWRERLPDDLAVATRNRIVTDLRAALNAAAERHRRILPAYIQAEIRIGTKAESDTALPRRQLLTDQQVRDTIEAAFEVDQLGDFGRLVLLLAATGARFSQIAKLKIRDVQARNARIMVPGSLKGRWRKVKPPIAVPISTEVIDRLKPVMRGRDLDASLLEHWSYRRPDGSKMWVRDKRAPWKFAYETAKMWGPTVERAGLSVGAVMYALRHSSIVRMLLKNIPVRIVAAHHDTSIEMIETHYAAFITDMSEGLARTAALSLSSSLEMLGAAE